MRFIISCLLTLLVCSCSKERLTMTSSNEVHTWNRELYRLTPSYNYINNVRISTEPLEKFVSYDIIKLSSQQAQYQQDSLFQASKGRYLYRFKKISTPK